MALLNYTVDLRCTFAIPFAIAAAISIIAIVGRLRCVALTGRRIGIVPVIPIDRLARSGIFSIV